jgi:hypothetical protein
MKMPGFAEEAKSIAINVVAIMTETRFAHEIPTYNALIHDVTEGGLSVDQAEFRLNGPMMTRESPRPV